MTPTGDFVCSDSLINKLQHNIQWGLRGNFLDVPTDCPQRDERLGWTGDAQVFAPTACFNMDAASFYSKWMQDFTVDQEADGGIPYVIPNVLKGSGNSATGWADANIIIPWTVYNIYGDRKILENQYITMQRWIIYMKNHSDSSSLFNSGYHFGDWLAFATNRSDYPGATTDKDLIATTYFAYSTQLMENIARILGKTKDAEEYHQLLLKIKSGFKKEFITENGRLTSNTQTAYVLALAFDLIPENLKARAAKRLADDVKNFGHLTTGFLGTPLLCKVLTDNNYPELANMLLFRKKYPSWLYPITMGATTIWERWDGIKPDGTFQDVGMNSFNHYAYGAIGNWLYTEIAGLNNIEPGYKSIEINPYYSTNLNFAKAQYHSIYGNILSEWKRENKTLSLHIEIPANTVAQIYLPVKNINAVRESGNLISSNKEMIYSPEGDNKFKIRVGSGVYNFSFEY
jgi:alpha-L-rhamnosidase